MASLTFPPLLKIFPFTVNVPAPVLFIAARPTVELFAPVTFPFTIRDTPVPPENVNVDAVAFSYDLMLPVIVAETEQGKVPPAVAEVPPPTKVVPVMPALAMSATFTS